MRGPTDVVDLNPLLRRRKQSACEHETVVVDDTLACLECENCGKQLNPYWWIARLCGQWDRCAQEIREYGDKIIREHQQLVTQLNHHSARLHAEIDTLEAKKRQLMLEQVGGHTLGKQVKRWRKPSLR